MEKNLENLHFTNPEEEIAFLREQISNRELELREKKVDFKIDDIVKEEIQHYRDVLPKEVLDETYALAQTDVESIVLNLAPERHDKKIEELLGILNKKGIKNTMSILSGFKDPHLEDDFHRFLVQYIKHGYGAKGVNISNEEFRGLGMTLYEVVLPENGSTDSSQEKSKPLKELISSMEQFLSGMLSVITKDDTKDYKKNYIVLEIANANGSDQFVFYVAVPDVHKSLFEKQIISVFHDAKLTEVTSDYNIFNADGISLGSYLESTNNPIYQFKTYENFDHDPLNIILNSFSKINKDGEGAGIQIVFAPKGDYFQKKYEYAIDHIEKGVPTKDAIDMPESFSGGLKKTVFSLFKSVPKESEEKKPIDTEAIQKIKQKIGSTIVATNIRLIASAQSRIDAERILQGLESSFNQFTDSSANGLRAKRLEKSVLQKMFRNYSFRSYNEDELLPLNLHEVTSLIHFQNTGLAPTPQLKQSQSISAPAPAEMGHEGTFLGVNNYRNIDTPIYMQDDDRLRHLYTIGQTGTGKTTLLKNMIIQDITAGKGCCFIDPHGPDVLDVLSNIPQNRFQDVIYFDPSYTERPMALNMLEYDKTYPEQKTFVVNELFSIFQKLYGKVPEALGPMFEQYFRNATMLVIEDPDTGCTLLDVSRVMTNKGFRDLKLSHCKNPVVVQFWTEVAEKAGGEASLANIVPYITSKFDVFLANDIMRPIIAQEKSSFDFRKIMDNKKILLINLSKGRLGDINSNLIGLILVGKILMAALSRADSTGDFPPFYLYIDEFQNITTNSIATILSEARKYKLSLNIAHQFIAQLQEDIRDAVFGNIGSIITFRVGAEDAEYLEKQFSPVFTAKDIMNINNYNFYAKILVGGKPVKAFNIKAEIPPKGNPAIIETLKQLSYLTYGGNRVEIEEDILKKYKK
ncbi:MAG: TraM recognition domain-containing protein [Candidatus Zambryskibacteria bacterium]|nr:TraM recognition domain-containing protein [Candidatus Zambryskibacteria bacterium]